MATEGEIDLNQVKAIYKIDDVLLVDSRSLEAADDYRLSFEISFGLALAALGATLQEYNHFLLLGFIVFLIFGLFFLGKYFSKRKKILETKKSSPSAVALHSLGLKK